MNIMEKEMTFDEWTVAIIEVLKLDKNLILVDKCINGEKHIITLKQFYSTVLNHEGWQPTLMKMTDYFCANYLFHNGINYTEQDVLITRALVLDYYADFAMTSLMATYKFV